MVTVYDPLKIERIQESPYGSTLFPDFMYYSIRPVRANLEVSVSMCRIPQDQSKVYTCCHEMEGKRSTLSCMAIHTLTHLRNCLSVLMMLWKHVSRETDIVTREC